MARKQLFSHKVNINDMRRNKKKNTDIMKKGVSKENVRYVFDTFYRDQVRALYNSITREK